jgi:hypothetical protein
MKQFIDGDPERPYICLLAVVIQNETLRRHIMR